MKNRKREICTSGTVRDEDGNILIYSANDRGDRGNIGIMRSPIRGSILPDRLQMESLSAFAGIRTRSRPRNSRPNRKALRISAAGESTRLELGGAQSSSSAPQVQIKTGPTLFQHSPSPYSYQRPW